MQPEQQVNILLVDDRPENLLALEAILEELGQTLITAHSGREALRFLLKREFAVILLDVQMPEMDGFETAALIREREQTQHTPIIFLTAINKSDTHVFRGYSLGAVDYMFKPFEPEVLRSKVRVFIELFKKTQEVQHQAALLRQANQELDKLNEDLERRVQERTAQLQAANEELQREIIERQRAQQEREQLLVREQEARKQAEAANRLKDEFLATVSHELRTPLSSILGWTRLLAGGKLDAAAAARAIETIERNAKAQSQLINDLLDVSRIITGKLYVNVRLIDLAPVVEAAVDAVVPAADTKGVQIEKTLDPALAPVSGDPDRLQQVVWNLLSNAVKFTPKGGQVRVRLDQTDQYARITVSDSGQGISPEFLPYVFDRFRQADGSITRAHGGLGLGLAIVRHLVELHGGTVQAESDGEGRGATFTVHFPLTEMQVADSGQRGALNWNEEESPNTGTQPKRAAAGEESAIRHLQPAILAGLRVLVVDDETDTLEMLRTTLAWCGAEVRTTTIAQEALDQLQRWNPDVLVSDIGMPGEDGYMLISKVRALGPENGGDTPALALTAYAREEDRRQALSAGYQTHLAKPVEPHELAAAVANLAKQNDKVGRTGQA